MLKNTKKVSIIGCGYVGSTIAYALMMKNLPDEIVLIDLNKKITEAERLDIRHGIPYMGICKIKSGTYEDIKDSDIIIITAGRNRKYGENRLDLAQDNVKIGHEIANQIKKYYNSGIVLIVANPVDIMTAKYTEWLGLNKGKVFGTGCILDSSRFTNVLADYLNIEAEVINAQIIGEHGNSQIAMWSKVTIAGMPIDNYAKTLGICFDNEIKNSIEKQVKDMGSYIIEGKGKTHYGIATCVCYIADAILNKRATIASVSSVLEGEYGIKNVSMSIPSIITSEGVERTLADYLNDQEYTKIKASYKVLEETLEGLK